VSEALDDVAWLLDRAAAYLLNRGEPQAARPLFQRAHRLYLTASARTTRTP
jgi:hypothetical protein